MAMGVARAEEEDEDKEAGARGGLPSPSPSPIYGLRGASGIGQCVSTASCGFWMRCLSGGDGSTRKGTQRRGSRAGVEACARARGLQ